jgi:hypothetical protein
MNSVPPSLPPTDHRRKLPNELLAEIFRSIHPKPVYASIQEWNNGVVNLLPLSSKMAYEFAGPIFHKKRVRKNLIIILNNSIFDLHFLLKDADCELVMLFKHFIQMATILETIGKCGQNDGQLSGCRIIPT